MKAIEERARQAAAEVCGGNEFYISGYIDGATEHRLIDIDEACEIFCDTCPDAECTKHCAKYNYFRKAMITMTDPLFEECLAKVDPEIRAEVRANMEKKD